MNIRSYVVEKEKLVSQSTGRLRDARVFDFNYVPDEPLMRRELKPVIDALIRYHQTGIANHILIVGSRGCGKTVSMLYLQRLFAQRDLDVLYANCRTYNTSYKILAALLGVRARGVSFAELAQRFADAYPEGAVVVLDEVDLLSEKDKNKDILYFLSRSSGNYMAVMLSNSPKWMSSLDESIQSTLQPELVYFRSYTAAEVGAILGERARKGVRAAPGVILRAITALTVKYTSSDVRVALKTLYYWATEPKQSVEDSFHKARKDITAEVVSNLNDKSLLILKAAAGAERPVKVVYEQYRQLCRRHNEEPYSYVYFYSTLSYLQSLGLILLISTKIRRTYTKMLQLTFPPEVLDRVWDFRFA